MNGASRQSLAAVQEWMDERTGGLAAAGLATLGEELLAVARLLGRQGNLRGSLADNGARPRQRIGVLDAVLTGKVGEDTLELLREVIRSRWSTAREMVDGVEVLGVRATLAAAELEGTIDRVEEELFRFDRALDGNSQLQVVLDSEHVPVERKLAVVRELLVGRADPTTVALVEHVVTSPRGREVEEAVAQLNQLAAERRQRILAEVRVPLLLDSEQEARFAAALTRLYGRQVQLHVVVDPTVLGGAVVRVGDEVIDGSVAHRLAQARQQMGGNG